MSEFDEYVAQQAAQKLEYDREATELKRQADEAGAIAAKRERQVFDRDVLGPLNAAAQTFREHAEALVETSRVGRTSVATLRVGSMKSPRHIVLTVQQNGTIMNVKVEGLGLPARVEEAVTEEKLPRYLIATLKDVADRWFGTNRHRNG